jgi:enoyl-CoA hydratase/carnithine racemase
MTEETVLVRRDGPIGVITINRPKVLNLFNIQVVTLLEEHLVDLESDAQVRAIVITGAGEAAFVGGADVADLNTRGALQHFFEFAEAVHRDAPHPQEGGHPAARFQQSAAAGAF